MQRTKVGNLDVVALVDNIQAYPATAVYPGATNLDAYSQHFDADGAVAMNFGCFLLTDGTTTILVDTGWGPDYNGRLLQELAEAQVDPGDINAIVFTHLHGDHTGWNIDPESGHSRFPNARFFVPGADWSHYSKQSPPPASFERDVRPLMSLGVMELFDGERDIAPFATAIPTPGHTPGHTSIIVSSDGERACILGDVVLSPVDVDDPTIANSFDWDSEIARATRLRLLDRLAVDGSLVGASHMPAPGLGRFVRTESRIMWQGFSPDETT